MAIVYDSRWRSLDSNGNPISGATLTIYTAGTTAPAAVFRDAALTTPMSNPTSGADKADSAGRFPQIYAAANALFDILEKDAGGTLIASYLSVTTLGSTTGSLVLDFTGERVQIRGAGGTGFIEFGDAAGDDVGGTGTIGGWSGTQADLITINAAVFNVLGRIKEGGFKIPGVIRQDGVTFSGVTNVAIPLTADPAGVRAFELLVADLVLSAAGGANLRITFSYDGGSTYASSGYAYSSNWSQAATSGATGSASDSSATLTPPAYSPTNITSALELLVTTPNSGNAATVATGQFAGFNFGGTAPMVANFAAFGPISSGRATHMKLSASTGNIAGVYRVVPQRGLGET